MLHTNLDFGSTREAGRRGAEPSPTLGGKRANHATHCRSCLSATEADAGRAVACPGGFGCPTQGGRQRAPTHFRLLDLGKIEKKCNSCRLLLSRRKNCCQGLLGTVRRGSLCFASRAAKSSHVPKCGNVLLFSIIRDGLPPNALGTSFSVGGTVLLRVTFVWVIFVRNCRWRHVDSLILVLVNDFVIVKDQHVIASVPRLRCGIVGLIRIAILQHDNVVVRNVIHRFRLLSERPRGRCQQKHSEQH